MIFPFGELALGIAGARGRHRAEGLRQIEQRALFRRADRLRPISPALGAVVGDAGDQTTAHAFRSIASTRLNERGVNPDLIELQLAHAEPNKVRAAYNRAQRISERRAMMQG